MEIVHSTGRISSQSMGNRWNRAGARVWRALVGSGMSQAAIHLHLKARHYGTGHQELAIELREAAKWAEAQKF
jgi:hypothetical protein